MGRKAEPGISYYRMDCSHIRNKKVRLLFSEFDADGYWVWQCILATAYEGKGYYFDCNDKDAMVLFASEVCRKRVSQVEEIIAGCIRRSLFDKGVFDMFGLLTSDEMQKVYLEATAERRRKGTSVEMHRDYLLIPYETTKRWENITVHDGRNVVYPAQKPIDPTNNGIDPRNNPQSKVKERKGKDDDDVLSPSPPLSSAPDTPMYGSAVLRDIEVLKKECLADQANFIEHICRQNRVKSGILPGALEDFNGHLRSLQEFMKSTKDYRKHFQYWFKKQDYSSGKMVI